MDTISTNWTKKEFLAYLLIYCMKADFVEHDSEIDFIRHEVGDDAYLKCKEEIDGDSDYTRIQKIQDSFTKLNFNAREKAELLEEINLLFDSDGRRDILEHNLFLGLNKLLHLK
jgi:hypothetical protein